MRLIRLLKNDLAREAKAWVEEGLISEAQAARICDRYGVDLHQDGSRSLGYRVLVGLGYLFIGLAMITLLGANWDEIPRALRMWGLILLTVSTQVIALRHCLSGKHNAGVGLFLLGNFFYGASIILIAQIYHLGEHMPDGVFWWALGCLPFAVMTKSPWLALQANTLALIWFFIEISLGYYPGLFPLFVLSSVYVLWKGPRSVLLLLAVLVSSGLWLEYSLAVLWREDDQFFLFDFHAEHLVVAVALFILLFATAQRLASLPSSAARDYAAIISVWSLRFALLLLLVLSFSGPWKDLLDADWKHLPSMWGVTALLGGGALWLAEKAGRTSSVAALLVALLLAVSAVLLSRDQTHAVYYQVAANFCLIATGIWLVVRGIHSGISHYFFLGVLSILVTALLRYFDLIGDYVGGAVMFIVFAALLLGAAKYWKYQQSRERLL
ncbi:DUF2157 domain-containing protein [Microbulbifer thermotolerans]|uniref:DUF2157 domain-containing protein n=1 Tax=Microbulbifer thermotolerans TaxID=252514 RepID=A0A143HLY4_MICTH|nr:DUF2157 domain-containing protein [Microbulbifer thermotolerans]AMX02709.1 hypothetical protein A3224_09050 [Microbulbifer thermotolerans]MCX2780350.1 DUF2157 domain-containing protein [Microbulbifer thermotolerans]MCX2802183.1 DUF2157 domain-containing protein [Microbulbifer thermotolerans]MCX2805978.1 DUF2157 domain-containing protein [Microbulbifer thermotolerans]MCX2832619.1 DUF2157 domain-containing protein [Microbulbifer thermotolerans]